jgi:hypothetical protein
MRSNVLKVVALALGAAFAVSAHAIPVNPLPTGNNGRLIPVNPLPNGNGGRAIPVNPLPGGNGGRGR